MATRSCAIVNCTTNISMDEVRRVAAAIQRQVLYHLAPTWGHNGAVIALHRDEPLPPEYYGVYLHDLFEPEGLAGIHYYTETGEIYANVSAAYQPWSLAASHEILEMIVDPSTDNQRSAPSLKTDQGEVKYLVEICDPCQHRAFAYDIDGVWVSDFYGQNYFQLLGGASGRYSMTGSITRPLEILPGGYITWSDSDNERWSARMKSNGELAIESVDNFSAMPGDSLREKVDFASASFAGTGCYVDLGPEFKERIAAQDHAMRRREEELHDAGRRRAQAQRAHHNKVARTIRRYEKKRRN